MLKVSDDQRTIWLWLKGYQTTTSQLLKVFRFFSYSLIPWGTLQPSLSNFFGIYLGGAWWKWFKGPQISGPNGKGLII